ncbi:MAG: hypothetical protein DRN53_04725 [Thermoprotei archaeon]|nr:MAG: hypothetical protein DRN53_04725 [Thermoprotei archaeon]
MLKNITPLVLVALIMSVLVYTYVSTAVPKPKPKLEVYEVTITAVTNTTIEVTSESLTGELIARGKWIIMTSESIGLLNWSEAMGYVSEGSATVIVGTIVRGNTTYYILIGLKQGDVSLIRPCALKHYARRHIHTKTYMSIKGEISSKGENFLVLDRNGNKVLVMIGGEWIKAGEGEVTWSEVANEFRVGDTLRIFYHNLLILKSEFTEVFGISAVIWGYSGAIINMDTGTALSKI